MDLNTYIDSLPLGMVIVITIGAMIACIELGFYVGLVHTEKRYKPQMAQVRAIMGALLGLVAFLLAFSFSMAQKHFEDRSAAYLMEANALGDAWRIAELLSAEEAVVAQDLLRQYVDSRVALRSAMESNQLQAANREFDKSEQVTRMLWELARNSEQGALAAEPPFVSAVLAIIDAKSQRLQATLYNRISAVIWFTLMLVSVLAMVVMGYQAGLTGTRSRLATWTLAVTFAAVMTLVTDLDRPRMSLFSLNNQIMIDLQYKMQIGDLYDTSRSVFRE